MFRKVVWRMITVHSAALSLPLATFHFLYLLLEYLLFSKNIIFETSDYRCWIKVPRSQMRGITRMRSDARRNSDGLPRRYSTFDHKYTGSWKLGFMQQRSETIGSLERMLHKKINHIITEEICYGTRGTVGFQEPLNPEFRKY